MKYSVPSFLLRPPPPPSDNQPASPYYTSYAHKPLLNTAPPVDPIGEHQIPLYTTWEYVGILLLFMTPKLTAPLLSNALVDLLKVCADLLTELQLALISQGQSRMGRIVCATAIRMKGNKNKLDSVRIVGGSTRPRKMPDETATAIRDASRRYIRKGTRIPKQSN
jgi:hypothetical protein